MHPVGSTSFSFTGRYYDAEAKLYQYRVRMYEPATGRFIQRDPRKILFRKGDREPIMIAIWRGWLQLMAVVDDYDLLTL